MFCVEQNENLPFFFGWIAAVINWDCLYRRRSGYFNEVSSTGFQKWLNSIIDNCHILCRNAAEWDFAFFWVDWEIRHSTKNPKVCAIGHKRTKRIQSTGLRDNNSLAQEFNLCPNVLETLDKRSGRGTRKERGNVSCVKECDYRKHQSAVAWEAKSHVTRSAQNQAEPFRERSWFLQSLIWIIQSLDTYSRQFFFFVPFYFSLWSVARNVAHKSRFWSAVFGMVQFDWKLSHCSLFPLPPLGLVRWHLMLNRSISEIISSSRWWDNCSLIEGQH
jgi:hypothetical protein